MKRTSTVIGFDFLTLILSNWKVFKVLSRLIQKASIPLSYSAHGLYVHKPKSIPPNRSPKMRESQQLFFGLRLVRKIIEETLKSRNPNQNSATLWRIFSSNKSDPANRNKGFYMYKPWSEQAKGWIHFCMKRLRTQICSNMLKYAKVKQKIKNI